MADYTIDKEAFDFDERGYRFQAWYLKEPKADALVKITKDEITIRSFLFPAYKVFNIAAHASDIIDSEIAKDTEGYAMAASTGFGGFVPIKEAPNAE